MRYFTLFKFLFCLCLASSLGCLPKSGLNSDQPDNMLESLRLPLWEEVLDKSLPPSWQHLGEVLSTREVSSSPLRIVSAGTDGNVLLWDLASGSGRLLKQVGGPMQFAALGRKHAIVAWSSGFNLTVACLVGCEQVWELRRLKTRITSLGFHEDDTALVIGGADGRVYRWHYQREGKEEGIDERDRTLERYIAHQTLISVVAPLHTGRVFFSADWDGQLYAWLAYTADEHQGSYDRNLFGGRFFGGLGNYMRATRAADRGIAALSISDSGKRFAVGSDDGYVEVWDVQGFEIASRTLIHVGRVISVALSADGSRVASLGRDGAIVVTDLVKDPTFGIRIGALRETASQILKEEFKSARAVYFLSNGNLLISTDSGQLGELKLSNTAKIRAPEPFKIDIEGATTLKGSDY